MYGHLNVILKTFLREQYGEDKWQAIVSKSGCAANYDVHASYDDESTKRLINSAATVLGMPRERFLVQLGEYYLEYLRKVGHDELLRNLGQNLLDFLENLDYIHTYMMTEFPNINMPSFRCDAESQKDKMTLHYYSFREDYHPLVMGIVKRAARVYFQSEVRIELISKTMEQVSNQKGKREHVVLSLLVQGMQVEVKKPGMGPPTLVAQTRKHGEKQIHQEDIEHVIERLEQIKREEGEHALPLNKGKVATTKWKSVAKMSMMYNGFVPQYPPKLSIDVQTFCDAFPYHFIFDKNMEIIHSGIKIQQLMPSIRGVGAKVDVFFELLHPHSVSFDFTNVRRFINTPFVVRTRATKMDKNWGKKPMVILRGQMLGIESESLVLYLCSPFVRCLSDLEERKMYLADIPIHDVTRDMLWLELVGRNKPAKTPRTAPQPRSSDRDLQAELLKAQNALELERRKNQNLFYALLPVPTANLMMKGVQPEPGYYKNVTVLFSDVVSFAEMVKSVKPHELCDMLSKLHTKYNRLSKVHGTFRVEAIGDAYMVVCGTPDEVKTHAKRVANVALGMRIATQEVVAPYKHRDGFRGAKIRIGIHSGPVVAGVIGDKIPRYLVFGETVNIASRLESHGVQDQIHISSETNSYLPGKEFVTEKRGTIDLRGNKSMTTYFLLSNKKVATDELMGYSNSRPRNPEGMELTFINEGKQVAAPATRTGTPQLLKNVVTTGYSNQSTPTGTRRHTPLTPPDDDYVPMMYN